jgi:hypothetical protein
MEAPQKAKYKTTILSSHTAPTHMPKRIKAILTSAKDWVEGLAYSKSQEQACKYPSP